jgi:transposase
MRRTGRSARWLRKLAFPTPRSAECGRRSACRPVSQTFKLSSDPLFVDKVRDIVGLYLSPPNRALVLSIDEKSQIQALDREQPVLPMMPGVPERRTHSYVRHGTSSLFAALDVASGFVIGKCYKRHRAVEFLKFLKEIDAQIPEGLDVHIVMDNYATHKTPKIKAWLARRPHYHVHFTPTSASWINQVERWFRVRSGDIGHPHNLALSLWDL